MSVAIRTLGWLVLYRCACGRERWQRPELWAGVCVRCERKDDPTSGFYEAM